MEFTDNEETAVMTVTTDGVVLVQSENGVDMVDTGIRLPTPVVIEDGNRTLGLSLLLALGRRCAAQHKSVASIKRYSIGCNWDHEAEPEEDQEGEWVKHEDVGLIVKEIRSYAIEQCADRCQAEGFGGRTCMDSLRNGDPK